MPSGSSYRSKYPQQREDDVTASWKRKMKETDVQMCGEERIES